MSKNLPSSLRRKVTNDVGVMTHDAFELIPLKLVFMVAMWNRKFHGWLGDRKLIVRSIQHMYFVQHTLEIGVVCY
jgi:hypothetical protein